jgi:regulator of protease activity HflC (stomatin/prohibitin superfamily)
VIKTKEMKKVKLNAYQVALVFKNGEYKQLLTAGVYWFWKNESIYVYEITQPFLPPIELNILLQDPVLADLLQVIELKDNEIALQYENGLLKNIMSAGRYVFWKSVIQRDFIKADISKIEIDENIDRNLLSKAPLNAWVRMYEVQSYENALLFVQGNYVRLLKPGVYYWWKNSITIQIGKVDVRQQQLEVSGQEILTKDKAALRINAWAQYRVEDIEKALLQNKDYDKQLYVLLQLAIREYIASFSFDELLDRKESIAPLILQNVQESAAELGVVVSDLGIRDIILPGDVKEIMNQVLVAEKKAQANTIMRREETASTRSLLNTAKLMEENAMLWKLKEMEYVEKIADKINNISVGSNGQLLEQLKQILVSK